MSTRSPNHQRRPWERLWNKTCWNHQKKDARSKGIDLPAAWNSRGCSRSNGSRCWWRDVYQLYWYRKWRLHSGINDNCWRWDLLPNGLREAVSKKPLLATVHADPLSQRELEVIRCIIEGMKNLEIVEALFISAETVKSHVSTVIQKLGVRDRTQAAVFALTNGLVNPHL